MAGSPHEQFDIDLLQAFPTERPHDLQIAECTCDECTEIRGDFAGYNWTDLPDSIIERHYCHLALLGFDAFRYFLPAFLRAALPNPESDLGEFLMYELAPSGIHMPQLSKFSDIQRSLVVRYLDLIALDEERRQGKAWKKTRLRWETA